MWSVAISATEFVLTGNVLIGYLQYGFGSSEDGSASPWNFGRSKADC
jgi:hypothetical protein